MSPAACMSCTVYIDTLSPAPGLIALTSCGPHTVPHNQDPDPGHVQMWARSGHGDQGPLQRLRGGTLTICHPGDI